MRIIETWSYPTNVLLATPPYQHLHAVSREWPPILPGPAGEIAIWCLAPPNHATDSTLVASRPRGVPLIVLLPPPIHLPSVAESVWFLPSIRPAGVLPYADLDLADSFRAVLKDSLQDGLGTVVARYLTNRGLHLGPRTEADVARVFDLAPEVRSVSMLATRMYASRRTLGRRFAAAGLPVPSHLLQFARLLHVALRLQESDTTAFRVACHYGYPDGFTMSNQMKRLLGCRPSEIRQCLGWEWIVERWLTREGLQF